MASSDEGEVIERGDGDLKATSLPYNTEGSGVDRRDRTHSRQSSADADSASRYSASSRRSRSPRGYKRSRASGDPYGNGRDNDSRYERRSYDDRRRDPHHGRPRNGYEDLDRPPSRGSFYDYDDRDRKERDRYGGNNRDRRQDDRDRYPGKRQRYHSPQRSRNADKPRNDPSSWERRLGRDSTSGIRYDDSRTSNPPDSVPVANRDKRFLQGSGAPVNVAKSSDEPSRPDHAEAQWRSEPVPETKAEPEPEPDYEEPEIIDEEAEIERRRKRREEILAKSSSATPLLLHAVGAVDKTHAASPATMPSQISDADPTQSPSTPRLCQSQKPTLHNVPSSQISVSPRSPGSNHGESPGRMDLTNDKALMNTHANGKIDEEDGPSAADYDPTVDMREDERRHGQIILHGESHVVETTEQQVVEQPQSAKPAKAAPADADDDDDFDMFAEDFDEEKFTAQPAIPAVIDSADTTQANDKGGILEGDDKDGYYKIRIGEVLNGRYQVQATLGRGMFSGVVRAVDMTTKQTVAIKIMRNNDALRKGGYTEIAILEKLNAADPDNKKHIVKFERSFDYKGHLCMAFENLSLNLREVLRKFGNNVGINLPATRIYAYQFFVSLDHMQRCSIIHADLKPDNILVNERRTEAKIADLGTAIDRSDAATAQANVTPYLVSRFYRAPEVILGIPYDYSVDMWSIGCTLYELYTGKILFTGDSNNQMLKAIMEVRGRITQKLFKRGQLSPQHFDEKGQFISIEHDKVLGKTTVRTLPIIKPTRDLRTRLTAASSGLNDAETRDLNHFIDLLEGCLTLNPEKRIKPADALKHPFFTSRHNTKRH